MNWLIAVAFVFIGCCTNVIFLETLVKIHPGCGNLITLAQFIFITIKGFIFETKCGKKKPVIPIRKYMLLVTIYFIVSVINNYSLNFNISMPLHMIFRSGSLITNMMFSVWFLKRKYSFREYFSIGIITVGIFICTLVSSREVNKPLESVPKEGFTDFFWWLVGLAMLTVSLFLSSSMGIIQEGLYKQYGKQPDEALFYCHVLTLPMFLIITPDLYKYVNLFNVSEPINLILFSIPLMWLYLIGNTLTQYVCISSVFVLTTECASLVVTLIVTLRKFVSLLISIVYFGNPFTFWHWVGTALVFVGTLLFTNIIKMSKDYFSEEAKKAQKKA